MTLGGWEDAGVSGDNPEIQSQALLVLLTSEPSELITCVKAHWCNMCHINLPISHSGQAADGFLKQSSTYQIIRVRLR